MSGFGEGDFECLYFQWQSASFLFLVISVVKIDGNFTMGYALGLGRCSRVVLGNVVKSEGDSVFLSYSDDPRCTLKLVKGLHSNIYARKERSISLQTSLVELSQESYIGVPAHWPAALLDLPSRAGRS